MSDPSIEPAPSGKGPQFDFDACSPQQMARRVEVAVVAKARQTILQTTVLGILAGAFIAFGALFYTLTITGSDFGFSPTRFLGGVAFSLGLILVAIGGAELFTGNNLIVMAWADRKITLAQLARNWGIIYVAIFLGAIGIGVLVVLSGVFGLGDGAVGETAAKVASGKLSLGAVEAFARGILCNMLAIPVAMMAGVTDWQVAAFLRNLIVVTAGNIVGGSGFVALTYWGVYLSGRRPD